MTLQFMTLQVMTLQVMTALTMFKPGVMTLAYALRYLATYSLQLFFFV